MSAPTIKQLIQDVQQIPPLSGMAVDLLASLDRDDVDVASVVQKISLDQGLTARVLRVANSSFYGLSGTVGSVSEALVVLGLHNVHSLLMASIWLSNQLPLAQEERGLDRHAFWQHGIGTAVCAQVLAQGRNQKWAFTAGLLHDIGKWLLDVYRHKDFAMVLTRSAAENIPLCEAERSTLGFDHARAGYELAKHWKLPAALQQAIRDHHRPEHEPSELTDLVHVANVLSHALDFGNADYDGVPPLSSAAWTRLGLDWETMPVRMAEIESQYAAMCQLIGE
ncbi:MAG: HDOD domain-containing protein [Burkholderiales bacterium]